MLIRNNAIINLRGFNSDFAHIARSIKTLREREREREGFWYEERASCSNLYKASNYAGLDGFCPSHHAGHGSIMEH